MEELSTRVQGMLTALSALQQFVRRGYGPFLLQALVLVTTAIAARDYFRDRGVQAERQRDQIARLITYRSHPVAGSADETLVAALTSSRLIDGAFSCYPERDSPVCVTVAELATQFTAASQRSRDSTLVPVAEPCEQIDGAEPSCCVLEDQSVLVDYDARRSPEPGCASADFRAPSTTYDRDLLAFVRIAAQMREHALAAVTRSPLTSTLDARIVQVYMVQPRGALALWSEDHRTPHEIVGSDLDLGLRAYADWLRTDSHHGESPIYLDRGSFGLIRSYCTPHWDLDRKTLVAALCVDVSVPLGGRYETRGSLVDSCLLDCPVRGRYPVPMPQMRDGFTPHEAERIASRSPVCGADFTHTRRRTGEIVVPAWRAQGRMIFMAIRPRVDPSRPLNGYLAMFLLSASVVVAGAALVSRRRQRAAEVEDTLLRDLPVGVIRVDENDCIVEANDRAEELLDLELPGLGVADMQPRRLDAILDPRFLITIAGKVGDDYTHYTTYTLRDANEARAFGKSSTYFVRRRSTGTWLAVHGSPWMHADSSADRTKTFAVLRPVSDARQAHLARALETVWLDHDPAAESEASS